jgi:amidase
VAGFLTRTVEDTALLLDVASDPKPERPFAEASRDEPEKLRIALSFKAAFQPARAHNDVRSSLQRLAETLRTLGHEVTERDPAYGRATDAGAARYLAGIAEDSNRFAQPERLQRRTRGFVRLGNLIPRPLLEKAVRDEARHAARINEPFRDHHVLLTPTAARPPVKAAQWEGLGAVRTLLEMAATYPFTGVWNMTGQPAISVPGPPASDGRPVGAQLVGPRDGEGRLLALAAQLERELAWPARRPPVG